MSDEVSQADDDGIENFLILQTNLHPPYQELHNGTLGGYSVSVLNCAFERIGVGYGLAVAPRQRNRELVRNAQADGFFLARISQFMDEYAVASNPLALEKWVWVSPSRRAVEASNVKVPKPDGVATIGAILGSNEAEWLSEEGYTDLVRVPSIASLVGQVAAGRVDYALIDKHSFEIARNELGIGAEQFLVQFERYAPLVVYFSKRYVAKFPDLIDRLNTVLEFCETNPMRLEPWERDAIERVHLPAVRQLARSPDLIRNVRAVMERNRMPADQRRLVDEEWTTMARLGEPSMKARAVLGNQLSEFLRNFQLTSGGQVAEAFVFDVYGQIIGMNRLTSDFDQSDEPQYQMAQNINRDHALIDDIRFDASTRAFLSQITVPILDPDSGQTLAVLTVGLDVSAALRPES
ncbi:hypothetical protein [Thalassospira sp. CH_XMU1448-2]|uniref:hypothetical protein n=1 Tax=Thalassospira sp. CH_XMU1448-2 TaxID=3107773 RepID=UPI003009A4A3